MASLAEEDLLNLTEPGVDQKTAESAVLKWLRANKSWLLILDNADTEQAAAEVEALLPNLVAGHVIITSRYTRWSASVRPQSLGLLHPKEATEFLLERTASRRIESKEDQSIAETLAKELGFLPLALEQTAAYIAHDKISLADYLEQWQTEKMQVLNWYNEREMKYPVSAAVTFNRTFDQLSLASRSVLRFSAFLAPDPIPTAMFEENSKIVAEAMQLLSKESVQDNKAEFNAKAAFGELASYSMITKESKSFTLHRIVQQVIRSRIASKHRKNWLEKALRLVNNFAPTDSYDVRTWPILNVLRPQAETIAVSADKAKITNPTARLMGVLGTYLHYKGLYDKAEQWKRRALEIDEAALGKDHPNVATDLNNLAQLYQATNRLKEAEPLMKRALEIDKSAFGKDHPNVAIRLNNLAQLYQDTNRLDEAEPLMKRALDIDEAALGKDHPDVAIDLNNLAQLYQATNRLKEAEPLMKRALEIDEASFGKDHPDVATDLNNLAQLYQDTNRLKEAEPLMKRALQIDEAAFGKDHPNVATDLNNLAQLYQATNRLKEAEPLMKRALDIDEAASGKDHPKVAIRLNNLAQLYQATNRLKEANAFMKRALKILETSLGPDHPDTIAVKNNLKSLSQ